MALRRPIVLDAGRRRELPSTDSLVTGNNYSEIDVTGLSGTVTLTEAQSNAYSQGIKGTLSANVTLVFPNWDREWRITNSATLGAWTLNVQIATKTAKQLFEADIAYLQNKA